jgi:hypothetical protein
MSFSGDALALRYRTTAMEAVRMSMLTRSITLGVLALGVGATALAAQQKPRGYSNYRWYIGAQGSYFNFQTTGQPVVDSISRRQYDDHRQAHRPPDLGGRRPWQR